MKKKILKLITGMIIGLFLPTNIVCAHENIPVITTASISSADEEISPYANVTGYKYIYIDGIKYKRLWSYTYARWEDSYWTVA